MWSQDGAAMWPGMWTRDVGSSVSAAMWARRGRSQNLGHIGTMWTTIRMRHGCPVMRKWPCDYGHTRSVHVATQIGLPSRSHDWTSTTRPYAPTNWEPRHISGRSRIGSPGVNVDTQRRGVFGRPHTIRGCPTTASLGRPIMRPTSRILGVHNVMSRAPR